jgi:predicted ATP-grasp superfamily ATP-dependent carboligase
MPLLAGMYNNTRMNHISVLIPDADVRLNVARCLAASRQAIVHGFALHSAPLLRHSKFFASFEEYKGEFNLKGWLSRIGEIVAERRIDVVLPISEFAIKTLSEHRQTLSWAATLPQLPNPHTFDIAIDKAKLADFLGSHGVPHPPTVVVTTGIPLHDRLSALEFPVLAKPPLSSGGIGIRRFESLEGLAGFLAEQPSDERWVVQKLIEGRDLGVNVLCRDGRILAATVQHAIKASSKPFETPIGIEFRDDPPAMNVAEKLIHELGWSGVANIDMRFDARHKIPMVLDFNGRYWFSLLGSLNAGVNFPLLACEMCLGEIKANRKPHKARYFSRKESALLSLVGGGRFGIRPHETDLRYLDPLPAAISLAKSAAASARAPFSRILARFTGGSV